MRRLLASLVIALAACATPDEPPDPTTRGIPPPALTDTDERANLLNMAHGASVVSRTGEVNLDMSAVRAIDGDPSPGAATGWVSPPADHQQTLTFALRGPARLTSVGVMIAPTPVHALRTARFETSRDGSAWDAATTAELKLTSDVQMFDITPRDATYVRVTTVDGPGQYVALVSVHARGTPAPDTPATPVGGCWTINGRAATFVQRGWNATGVIEGTAATELNGATDGSMYRFVWLRQNEWGVAAVTASPDGRHLSGIKWHDVAHRANIGETWFGERCNATRPYAQDFLFIDRFIGIAGYFPLYALQFEDDGTLRAEPSREGIDAIVHLLERRASHRFVLLAREYRQPSREANRSKSAARLESLRAALKSRGADLDRLTFRAMGSDDPRVEQISEPVRALYGCIEVEISR